MKRLLACLLLFTVTIALLTACGGMNPAGGPSAPYASKDSSAVTEATPEQKPVVLRAVGMFGGTDPTGPEYQRLIKDFMSANPGITILDESATADETWKALVATDFSCGNDPDVALYFTGPDAKQLIENKKVVSIEEIKKAYPDYIKDISDHAMGFMREYDGSHYAVPVRGFYEGLFCNKDLFDKYGLELPADWVKFEAAIKRFKEVGIIPIAVSFSDVPHYWIEHLILAEGGIADHSINPKDTYPDSWARALGYLRTLKDMGAFPVDVNATKNDIVSNLFYNKQAAMIIDGSWNIGGIKDPSTTVVLPMPATPDGKKNTAEIIGGFSSGFYISTNAWNDPDKRDAAARFVMHMTSKEAISAYTKTGSTPAADVPMPDSLTKVMKSGLEMDSQAKKAKRVNMPIDSRLSKEAWTYFISMIGPLADGQAQPEEVLAEVVRKNR